MHRTYYKTAQLSPTDRLSMGLFITSRLVLAMTNMCTKF